MPKTALLRIPLVGIPLFVVLYVWATVYYPGGSQANIRGKGFSWVDNYWCNLLNDTAINGEPNPAKPIAMAAMVILCISLAAFWTGFASYALARPGLRGLTKVSGTMAMGTALLLSTNLDHDMVTNLASLLGLVAIVGTLMGLYTLRWRRLFWFGVVNLVLVVLNNLFYYNASLVKYLPLVQKISFAFFLEWFFLITIGIIRTPNSFIRSRP